MPTYPAAPPAGPVGVTYKGTAKGAGGAAPAGPKGTSSVTAARVPNKAGEVTNFEGYVSPSTNPQVTAAVEPARSAPTGGATSGRSGATGAAQPSVTRGVITSAQNVSPAQESTKTKTKGVAKSAAPTLANGDLTDATLLNTYIQGQQDQATADATNQANQDTANQSAANQAAPTSSSSGGGILSRITSNARVLIIGAGVLGVGYYLYRRNGGGSISFGPRNEGKAE